MTTNDDRSFNTLAAVIAIAICMFIGYLSFEHNTRKIQSSSLDGSVRFLRFEAMELNEEQRPGFAGGQ